MFGRSRKKKTSLSTMLIGGLIRTIGTTVVISALAGGLARFIFKSMERKPQKPTRSGVYGAVAIAQAFKGADFPMSKQDIMDCFGNIEIEYHRGKREKIRDVLSGIPNETFSGTFEVEHAFHEFFEKNK